MATTRSKSTKPGVPVSRQPKPAQSKVSSSRQTKTTIPGMQPREATATIDLLQDRLVALIDTALTLKHIHWNVVGPAFIGVHEMLDPQVAGVQAMVDRVAERIATLGGSPNGLPGNIVTSRSWDDYDLQRADAQAHLAALDLVYSGLISDHRDAIEAVGDLDPITEDILIGHTGTLEQYQWFVRAHLEDAAGGLSNAGERTERGAAAKALGALRATR